MMSESIPEYSGRTLSWGLKCFGVGVLWRSWVRTPPSESEPAIYSDGRSQNYSIGILIFIAKCVPL